MTRGSNWWNEPPWWAWAVAVAGVVLLAVGLPYAAQRGHPSAAEIERLNAEAASGAEQQSAAPEPPTSITLPPEPQLLVFGDSYVEGNGADSRRTTFAYRTAEQLGWPVQTDGVGGTGFLDAGPDGDQTYSQRLAALELDAEPNIVVIEGGINDRQEASRGEDVEGPALAFLQQVQAAYPGAAVVLMGPVNPIPPEPGAGHVTAALAAAAQQAGVPFIDASGWLTEDNIGEYSLGDNLHVNQAGHDYLGGRLAAAVKELAGQPAQ